MPRLTIEAYDDVDMDEVGRLYEDLWMGSDNFDLCSTCAEEHDGAVVSDPSPEWLSLSIVTSIELVLVEVEHPTYGEEELEYACCQCGKYLDEEDD